MSSTKQINGRCESAWATGEASDIVFRCREYQVSEPLHTRPETPGVVL